MRKRSSLCHLKDVTFTTRAKALKSSLLMPQPLHVSSKVSDLLESFLLRNFTSAKSTSSTVSSSNKLTPAAIKPLLHLPKQLNL